ncbi:MAG TPA: hypothetical protein VD963_10815 [Phycisphaerales bacterium]|nr:hypothetical protein [Phycisphaerales bacterium]
MTAGLGQRGSVGPFTPVFPPVPGAAPLRPALAGRQQDFAGLLARAEPLRARGDAPERARAAAEDLVAITFVQPLLKELRESNRAAPPFAPGPAEKQFRAFADAELARRIASASRFPLVDAVARRVLRGAEAPPPPARSVP